MHDWQSEVRARLKPLRLRPERAVRPAELTVDICHHTICLWQTSTRARSTAS